MLHPQGTENYRKKGSIFSIHQSSPVPPLLIAIHLSIVLSYRCQNVNLRADCLKDLYMPDGSPHQYKLIGIIYFNGNHFVCATLNEEQETHQWEYFNGMKEKGRGKVISQPSFHLSSTIAENFSAVCLLYRKI
jgi:hypothetical protein